MKKVANRQKVLQGKGPSSDSTAFGAHDNESAVDSSNALALERLKDTPPDDEDPKNSFVSTKDKSADDSDEVPPPDAGPGPEVAVKSETEVEGSDEEEAEVAATAETEAEVDEAAEQEQEVEPETEKGAGANEAANSSAALEGAMAQPSPLAPPSLVPAAVPVSAKRPQAPRLSAESASIPFTQELFAAHSGFSPEEHAAMSNEAFADLDQVLGTGQSEVAAHAAALCAQIDSAIESKVATVWSAFEGASTHLASGFMTARANVEGFAATAFADIDSAASVALARVDTAQSTQVDALRQGFDAEVTRLGSMSDAGVARFTAAFDTQVEAIRQTGEQKAQEALSLGEAQASGYKSRGGDGLEGKRNKARAAAAQRVAKDYAVGLRDKANEVANEVAQGSANIPEIVSQMVDPVVGQLSTAQADAEAGVNSAAEAARLQVDDQRVTACDGIEVTRSQAMTTLDEQESASREDLRGLATTFEQNLRNAGEGLKEQIGAAAAELGVSYAEAAASIEAALAGQDMPNGPDVQAACAVLMAEFEAEKASHLKELDTAAQTGLSDLDVELQSARTGIQQASEQAVTSANEMASELGNGLLQGAAGFATGMDELVGTIDAQLGDMVTGALEGARTSVDATGTSLTEQEQCIVTDLDAVISNVGSSLGEAMGKLPADIDTEAESAASKVQPWWKKALAAVVSVVVAIVVAVAVAAFCVATLGAGAIVAGIIAGGVAGIAATFASDATMSLLTWSNQFSSWETYVAAGLTGAAMGGVGAWAGPMLKGANLGGKLAGGTGISFLSSSVDQVLDITLFGEDWNWGEWFVGGTVGALLTGISTRFVPDNFGKNIRKFLFSRGGGNSWNNFQSMLSKIPGLGATTPTQRAQIYQLMADTADDTPKELLDKITAVLDVRSDSDKEAPDPSKYEGDGSRVQFPEMVVSG